MVRGSEKEGEQTVGSKPDAKNVYVYIHVCVHTCKYTQMWASVNLCNTHGNLSFSFEHSNRHWSDGRTEYGHFLYCIHTDFLYEFPHLWIFIGHLLYGSRKILHVYLRHPKPYQALRGVRMSESNLQLYSWSHLPFHSMAICPGVSLQQVHSHAVLCAMHGTDTWFTTFCFLPWGGGRAEGARKPSILVGTYYYSLCISY